MDADLDGDDSDGLTVEQRKALDELARELSCMPGIDRVMAESYLDSQCVLIVAAVRVANAALQPVSAAIAIRKQDLTDPKLLPACLRHIGRVVASSMAGLN